MALPEETDILREIGLGQHYHWYNGSGSCREIRLAAAGRLEGTLRAHGCVVDVPLVELVRTVAEIGEASVYVLTKTWEAASSVIQLHLQRRDGMDDQSFVAVAAEIERLSRPRRGPLVSADGTTWQIPEGW